MWIYKILLKYFKNYVNLFWRQLGYIYVYILFKYDI